MVGILADPYERIGILGGASRIPNHQAKLLVPIYLQLIQKINTVTWTLRLKEVTYYSNMDPVTWCFEKKCPVNIFLHRRLHESSRWLKALKGPIWFGVLCLPGVRLFWGERGHGLLYRPIYNRNILYRRSCNWFNESRVVTSKIKQNCGYSSDLFLILCWYNGTTRQKKHLPLFGNEIPQKNRNPSQAYHPGIIRCMG